MKSLGNSCGNPELQGKSHTGRYRASQETWSRDNSISSVKSYTKKKYGEEFQFALVFILMGGRHDHTDSALRMPAYLIKHSVIEHNQTSY